VTKFFSFWIVEYVEFEKCFFPPRLCVKMEKHITSRSLARKKKEEINPICIAIVRKYFPWKTFLLQCSRYFTHVSGPSAGYPFSHTCRERSTTKKQHEGKKARRTDRESLTTSNPVSSFPHVETRLFARRRVHICSQLPV